MQLDQLTLHSENKEKLYYSLQYPIASQFKPSSRSRTSIISDLHEICSLMKRYKEEICSNKYNIDNTSLFESFKLTDIEYFHSTTELHNGMRNSNFLFEEDPLMRKTIAGEDFSKFPDHCAFVKGCIRISHKD